MASWRWTKVLRDPFRWSYWPFLGECFYQQIQQHELRRKMILQWMKLMSSHELEATSKAEPDNSHSMEIAQIVLVQPIEQGTNDRSDFGDAIASCHVVDGLRSKPPIYLQKLSEREIIDSARPLISYHQWKWNWSRRDQAELGRLSDEFRRWHRRSIREFWEFRCLNKAKAVRCDTHDILIGKSRR